MRILKKIVPPLIPYITVSTGLLVFKSAWIAIFTYHAGMVAVLLLAGNGIRAKQILHSKNYLLPALMAIIGASGGILLYLLWGYLSIPDDLNSYLQGIGLTAKTWLWFMAYHIIINPFIEEYYWRGHLGSNRKTPELNDLLFSGYHLIVLAGKMETMWLIVVFIALSFSAWFWRQTNRISEGLLPSVVSHLTADITVIITIYIMSMK